MALSILSLIWSPAFGQTPLGTEFTYQGQLKQSDFAEFQITFGS